ncbi:MULTISPECIES: hypothetical protein [Arthrospira]|uniref:hypothetical protein n=1 Tax=Oscillatoriales TaxID=1150 RepID=UPI001378D50F|nr:hypothetical protein [Arthrospira platensis]MBD2671877.1 hypothetical protein [Arthrospira platensis FACHB-439]MBD2713067.1 hypothetical protein [Arthrospira platensis FACHB-835]MDF2212917.1 hypothetical protein [Arthrospira platensis NCB002]MDT9185719.1 hypothetical protein [Limnospira sp. PMC 289.06]MDT9297964.1 hypothetical protein [Arthrospira platensis PCC 7345]MDT9313374.1 hypothetical protein [Limnospira sp. Paracas R14]
MLYNSKTTVNASSLFQLSGCDAPYEPYKGKLSRTVLNGRGWRRLHCGPLIDVPIAETGGAGLPKVQACYLFRGQDILRSPKVEDAVSPPFL